MSDRWFIGPVGDSFEIGEPGENPPHCKQTFALITGKLDPKNNRQ